MYVNNPCAYCGKTKYSREKGHVIPQCMFPDDTEPRIQRPTVPECSECKKLWQKEENQFRNILVLAGDDPNSARREKWNGQIKRSFHKPSGHVWIKDLKDQMVPIKTENGNRHVIYPAKDPKVMVVIKKIIRGLCHYHKIEASISENRVWADVLKYRIPSALFKDMKSFDLGIKLLQYGYKVTMNNDPEINSYWYFKFYEKVEFIGIVFKKELNPTQEG